MKVKLLHTNGLEFVDNALGNCYNKGPYCDVTKRDNRIKKVALKLNHSSTLEFCNFIFEIEASTKVLLEMTRHRIANYACKSSRYTLNKGEVVFESTGNIAIDKALEDWKETINIAIGSGVSNDIVSLMLPQAYQYRWQVQFNARSLINFFELRRAKSAHFQIRDVANAMFEEIPTELKYLFDKGYKNESVHGGTAGDN